MYLLGYDIGSSSVKASLVNADTGKCVATAFYPKSEAPIISKKTGWAEQDPAMWWGNLKLATDDILDQVRRKASLQSKTFTVKDIQAIGISYQMHGLVCVDKDMNVLRPSIIWCDSRAVPYGQKAFDTLGKNYCLPHLLNSPGNFTAAKLAWVKENEPDLYSRIWKVMLPGDYIAMRLTGSVCTTVSGLSEGIFWDFKKNSPSKELLDFFGFEDTILAPTRPTFGVQGTVSREAAEYLGLTEGTPVTYRAGDQPNNALSLNVEAIMPTCEEYGMNMCVHPDDPPIEVLGLPRIVRTEEDIEWFLNAVPNKHNGLTFCAGSLSAGAYNNVVELARKFASRTHFVHLRSCHIFPNGDFTEASHLGGRADLIELCRIFEKENPALPMRVDHGLTFTDVPGGIFDESSHGHNAGYTLLGRMFAMGQVQGILESDTATPQRKMSVLSLAGKYM